LGEEEDEELEEEIQEGIRLDGIVLKSISDKIRTQLGRIELNRLS
jgi:hypothetical protein